nr:putative glycosyltransferase [Anoectochilus roxburghii]
MASDADHCYPNSGNPLHFLLIPLMAPGHMIPMLDLARLLASRRVLITFITTPVNLARIRPIVDRSTASALPIRFIELRFPVADVGLPDGCENADLVPSLNLMIKFMCSVSLLREPLEAYLHDPKPDHWPPPSCLISDNLHHWTADIARSLNIPRLIFHGTSCFFLLCSLLIQNKETELKAALAAASGGPITLPGLPQPILVYKHQVIWAGESNPLWFKHIETIREVEKSADGVLINSFVELEPWYLKNYHEAKGKPIWSIGPLSLYQEELDAKADRGQVSSIDHKLLIQWLDGKEHGSVVLVSFGSSVRHTKAQLMELGYGLKASGYPFIWMAKGAEGHDSKYEEWLAEFVKEVEGRGLVIRGWAPQTLILGHVAVGGFLTHCGWNSTLEAMAAGVVMATWPCAWDQFYNERFVVDVLNIGVAIGVNEPFATIVDDGVELGGLVLRKNVERAVVKLMRGGEEGEKRRERVRELSEKARRAMEEGGSSWEGLQDVFTFVLEFEKKKKKQQQQRQ